jgi:CRP/FNR family transcriptional regulator, cyclic AMP receptor protein
MKAWRPPDTDPSEWRICGRRPPGARGLLPSSSPHLRSGVGPTIHQPREATVHHHLTIDDRVANLPTFADTPRRNLRSFLGLMTPVTVRAGRVLTSQGGPGTESMLIVDGRVRVFRDGCTLATLGPGDVVGEIAVLHGGSRTATAIADGPTTLEVMTPVEFDAVLHEHEGFARYVAASVAARLPTH